MPTKTEALQARIDELDARMLDLTLAVSPQASHGHFGTGHPAFQIVEAARKRVVRRAESAFLEAGSTSNDTETETT